MKDSYWFKHDVTAGRGLKLRQIQHIYGHEGKGFYWDVIEVLREQEKYRYSTQKNALEMLASIIGSKDTTRFISWFNDCIKFELFFIRDNYFYNKPLQENMKLWESKKRNGSEAKRKRNGSETEAKLDIIEQNRTIRTELIEDEIWKEATCINRGIKKEEINKFIMEFERHLISTKESHQNKQTFAKHFYYWYPLYISKKPIPKFNQHSLIPALK